MWEIIYTTPTDIMERLAVDGGWLYRNRVVMQSSAQSPHDYAWGVALTFVPEPAAPPLQLGLAAPPQLGLSGLNTLAERPR